MSDQLPISPSETSSKEMDDDSLKLSYEMLFQESSDEGDRGSGMNGSSADQSDSLTNEKMDRMLAEQKRELEAQLEAARAEAMQQGIQQGRKLGKQEALEEYSGHADQLRESLEQINRQIIQTMEELKPYLASLVFDLTEKVLELPVNSEALRNKMREEIEEILATLDEELKARIEVSEDDMPVIEELLGEHISKNRVRVTNDPELLPGEYRVDTPDQQVVKCFKKSLYDIRDSITFGSVDVTEKGPDAEPKPGGEE